MTLTRNAAGTRSALGPLGCAMTFPADMTTDLLPMLTTESRQDPDRIGPRPLISRQAKTRAERYRKSRCQQIRKDLHYRSPKNLQPLKIRLSSSIVVFLFLFFIHRDLLRRR